MGIYASTHLEKCCSNCFGDIQFTGRDFSRMIIEDFRRLSESFDVTIDFEDRIGVVRLFQVTTG